MMNRSQTIVIWSDNQVQLRVVVLLTKELAHHDVHAWGTTDPNPRHLITAHLRLDHLIEPVLHKGNVIARLDLALGVLSEPERDV